MLVSLTIKDTMVLGRVHTSPPLASRELNTPTQAGPGPFSSNITAGQRSTEPRRTHALGSPAPWECKSKRLPFVFFYNTHLHFSTENGLASLSQLSVGWQNKKKLRLSSALRITHREVPHTLGQVSCLLKDWLVNVSCSKEWRIYHNTQTYRHSRGYTQRENTNKQTYNTAECNQTDKYVTIEYMYQTDKQNTYIHNLWSNE